MQRWYREARGKGLTTEKALAVAKKVATSHGSTNRRMLFDNLLEKNQ